MNMCICVHVYQEAAVAAVVSVSGGTPSSPADASHTPKTHTHYYTITVLYQSDHVSTATVLRLQ